MKRKLTVFIAVLCVILVSGCFNNMSPSEKVEEMLSKYIKNDKNILTELDTYMDKQDLSNEQKDKYKRIIKDEYASIKYKIKDEKIDGDNATVEVSIEVKDLYKGSKIASDYLIDHTLEFYTNDIYDEDKFIDYKLDTMEKNKDTITYTIFIGLTRKDGMWTIDNLDNEILEKIHGIYNYESDK